MSWLFVYLLAAISAGALLTFPVHAALSRVANPAFDSVLHRVAGLCLLLLLPAYLASASRAARPTRASARVPPPPLRDPVHPSSTASSTREALGLACTPRAFRRGFLEGFALGVLVVWPLAAAFLVLGIRAPAPTAVSASDVAAHAAYALLAAAVIGLIEEAYFRGALLAPLRRLHPGVAISIVSVVYAGVHFVGAPVPAEGLSWTSGLSSVARSELPLDAFLALFAAGLFLGALRLRFGHIALGAGFHAGWVFVMKLNQEYTDIVPGSDWAFLEGTYGGTMGYLGLAWIALLAAGWYAWARWSAARTRASVGGSHAARS